MWRGAGAVATAVAEVVVERKRLQIYEQKYSRNIPTDYSLDVERLLPPFIYERAASAQPSERGFRQCCPRHRPPRSQWTGDPDGAAPTEHRAGGAGGGTDTWKGAGSGKGEVKGQEEVPEGRQCTGEGGHQAPPNGSGAPTARRCRQPMRVHIGSARLVAPPSQPPRRRCSSRD